MTVSLGEGFVAGTLESGAVTGFAVKTGLTGELSSGECALLERESPTYDDVQHCRTYRTLEPRDASESHCGNPRVPAPKEPR